MNLQPNPEPKPAEEPIVWDWAEGRANSYIEDSQAPNGDKNLSRAYLALRAENAALRAEVETVQYERDCHIRGASELKAGRDALAKKLASVESEFDLRIAQVRAKLAAG